MNIPLRRHLCGALGVSIALVLLGFFVYARIFPHSIFSFYWDDLAVERLKDARAREYLDSFQTSTNLFAPSGADMEEEGVDLCIAIPSADREVEYFYRSLASITLAATHAREDKLKTTALLFDTSLRAEKCSSLSRFIANTNLHCLTRKQVLLSNTMEEDELTLRRIQEGVSSPHWIKRERTDYALALNWCLKQTNARHVIVLQDDGIMSRDGISRALHAAQTMQDFAVLQLYSSDFWRGFEIDHVPYFILAGVLGGALGALVAYARADPRRKRGSRLRLTMIYCIFGAVWAVLGPLIIGKQHLLIIGTRVYGGIVPSEMLGPGIVAYLYPRDFAGEIVHKILHEPCGGSVGATLDHRLRNCEVDLFVDAQVPRGRGFELLPNVVDHVGFVSSNADKRFYDWYHPHHVRSGSYRKSAGSPF